MLGFQHTTAQSKHSMLVVFPIAGTGTRQEQLQQERVPSRLHLENGVPQDRKGMVVATLDSSSQYIQGLEAKRSECQGSALLRVIQSRTPAHETVPPAASLGFHA